jgi:hypothetical protein
MLIVPTLYRLHLMGIQIQRRCTPSVNGSSACVSLVLTASTDRYIDTNNVSTTQGESSAVLLHHLERWTLFEYPR